MKIRVSWSGVRRSDSSVMNSEKVSRRGDQPGSWMSRLRISRKNSPARRLGNTTVRSAKCPWYFSNNARLTSSKNDGINGVGCDYRSVSKVGFLYKSS